MCGRMHLPGETQFLRTFQAYKIGELGLEESYQQFMTALSECVPTMQL
jgi:hypothetical protein